MFIFFNNYGGTLKNADLLVAWLIAMVMCCTSIISGIYWVIKTRKKQHLFLGILGAVDSLCSLLYFFDVKRLLTLLKNSDSQNLDMIISYLKDSNIFIPYLFLLIFNIFVACIIFKKNENNVAETDA
jgi:hypothetical protein